MPLEDPGPLLDRLPDSAGTAWVRGGDGLVGSFRQFAAVGADAVQRRQDGQRLGEEDGEQRREEQLRGQQAGVIDQVRIVFDQQRNAIRHAGIDPHAVG